MERMDKLLNFGIINFDKPAGPTSYSVSEFVRRALGLKKTSHMGTLDPKVTGVLPITLGRACKLASYFITHDKTYVGVLETHKECSMDELQDLIDKNFIGKIRQTPPHRSAVAREEREREVYYWKLTEASEDGRYFLFEVKCEGGTYIRKLCSDLGEMIGGAHMGELRRTHAGVFSETGFACETADAVRPAQPVRPLRCETELAAPLVRMDEFEAAVEKWKAGDEGDLRRMVVDARDAIREVLPVVEVDRSALKSLYVGRPLLRNNVVSGEVGEGESFAAFCGKEFVGVYRKVDGKDIFGMPEFVCN